MKTLNPDKRSALHHARAEYQGYLAVNWLLFNVCNYSCSYCVPGLNDGSHKGVDPIFMMRFIHRLMKQMGDRKVYFEFTGGEVTFHPDIDTILEFIKEREGLTGIISNGSRPVAWWKERLHLFDHVCLSFHPERGDQEHFARVVELLNQSCSVHVNIMMTPENFDDLNTFARRILKSNPGISLAMQPLFEKFTGPLYEYTEEQKLILEKPDLPYMKNPKGLVVRGSMKTIDEEMNAEIVDPTLLISRGENKWKGWSCAAGIENIAITMSGMVTRGICHVGGVIGNIKDPNFELPKDPVICPQEYCHCAFDIMSTKTRVPAGE